MPSIRLPGAVLTAALSATVLAYWAGLNGPFLLDDDANLSSLAPWLEGKLGLDAILFERGGGVFGRPVSMALFALNAWLGGYTPFSLKLGNLIVHLLCGLTLFGLLQALLKHDPRLQSRATLYSSIIAAIWLLHPLHASTVLYVVQRMAQLSTLLTLAGLWVYVVLRERLQRGPSIRASIGLLLGIPSLTILAFLAKENGALLPLLCTVLEFSYFRSYRCPATVKSFHIGYVLLPFLIGLIGFALNPERITGGYELRDFTLYERLISQGRVLCDYLWKLVAPNPPLMGIYTDDFAASTGLFSPPTTVICILLLAGFSYAAWRLRAQWPSVFFGWFLFLAAHALEAGPISLELYFEHRNYLPSVGILLALVALGHEAGVWLSGRHMRPSRIAIIVLPALLLLLALGAHGRARVWSDRLLIAESSLEAHPQSMRAAAEVLLNSLNVGDRKRADAVVAQLLDSPLARNKARAHLYRLFLACMFDHRSNPADLQAFIDSVPLPLQLEEAKPFGTIQGMVARNECAPLDNQTLGIALTRLADKAPMQADHVRAKILLRYYAAQAFVASRDWPAGVEQGRLAWQSNAEAGIAGPLLLSQLGIGDFRGAEITYEEVRRRSDPNNAEEQAGLRWIRQEMEAAQAIHTARTSPISESGAPR